MKNEAKNYWNIGIQYIDLAKVVATEIVNQGNKHLIVSDEEVGWDKYDELTKWSDHKLIIPLLFDFYHGIEVIIKGFLLSIGLKPDNLHKLSKLSAEFAQNFPNHAFCDFLNKYIEKDKLPELIKSFCTESNISIDDYYQALKYPHSNHGNIYHHYVLKYRGKKGVDFFEKLIADIDSTIPQIVTLGRSLCP